jgi:hypothetical protein
MIDLNVFHLHRSRIHHKSLIYHLIPRTKTLKPMFLTHPSDTTD